MGRECGLSQLIRPIGNFCPRTPLLLGMQTTVRKNSHIDLIKWVAAITRENLIYMWVHGLAHLHPNCCTYYVPPKFRRFLKSSKRNQTKDNKKKIVAPMASWLRLCTVLFLPSGTDVHRCPGNSVQPRSTSRGCFGTKFFSEVSITSK